jgi:tRNA G10  N-methylase Trm11
MKYLLFVGSFNTLSTTEVLTQIPSATQISADLYGLEAETDDLAIDWVSRLGCSIKLAKKLDITDKSPLSITPSLITKNFSLYSFDPDINTYSLSHEIKSLESGKRYILGHDKFGLSPVILHKQSVTEIFILRPGEYYQTIWSHDYKAWINKDRHLPQASGKVGMLPPKIARSIINTVPFLGKDRLLVDPFCGFGRILVEGSELGYRVAGTDIDPVQVQASKANLAHMGIDGQIHHHDATHLDQVFDSIDLIVTEPYMGATNIRPDRFPYVATGLMKLYLGALKNWQKLLTPGGYVVMIFPIFINGRQEIRTSRVIDDPHLVGYNQTKRGLDYYREKAVVRREIVILQKQ